MRYKVVPARGLSLPPLTLDDSDVAEALELAGLYSEEQDMPMLVVEAPRDGIVRHVALVGGTERKRR